MQFIPAKTIVTKTKSDPWFGIDYNMNIYKGCNHGCIYCDSRSECYRIDDFDRVRAKFIYPAFGMTLRGNQKAWYYKKLDEKFPSIKQKYIRKYGDYYECRIENSNLLWGIFANECEKLGILYKMKDIIKEYKSKYNNQQLTLFD